MCHPESDMAFSRSLFFVPGGRGLKTSAAKHGHVLGLFGVGLIALTLAATILGEPGFGYPFAYAIGHILIGMGLRWSFFEREGGTAWKLAWMGQYAVAGVAFTGAFMMAFEQPLLSSFLSMLTSGVLAIALWTLGRKRDDDLFLAAGAAQVALALPPPWLAAELFYLDMQWLELAWSLGPLVHLGAYLLLGAAFVRWAQRYPATA